MSDLEGNLSEDETPLQELYGAEYREEDLLYFALEGARRERMQMERLDPYHRGTLDFHVAAQAYKRWLEDAKRRLERIRQHGWRYSGLIADMLRQERLI